MKSHWVEHQGKRVFIADFSGFGDDSNAVQKECDEIVAELKKEPLKSVLSISNATGTNANVHTVRVLKRILAASNPFINKRATVGVKGGRRFILAVFNEVASVPLEPFDTMLQALDWIVKD
ncbi:MAG: hypothetical protein EHM81_10400 [Chloroflexi bacterium]|nr:MAG: hypothetical protein EHM81_10400 [Chloroflexota bacterium]